MYNSNNYVNTICLMLHWAVKYFNNNTHNVLPLLYQIAYTCSRRIHKN